MSDNSFFAGIRYALAGIPMIFRPKLRRFVIIPSLINIIIFSLAIGFGYHWLDDLMSRWLPEWLYWLRYLIWPILAFLAMLMIFFCFTLLANLFAAPFNSLLSEAVFTRLNDHEPGTNANQHNFAKEALLSIQSEINKLFFFSLRAIPLVILLFIPGINLFASVLWFLFGAWVLTHQYMDYPMDNNHLTFAEQRALLRKRRFLVLGFGSTILILTMIPFLNFISMPVAVCGATLMWYEQFYK